jgi:predicted TIM-barrel fold metal-dependent hydrolase
MDVVLVDHHCHAVARGPLGRPELESYLTESHRSPAEGCSAFDSALGIAVRRWCAPALGLPAGAGPDAYVAARLELGPEEANRRLLRAAGLDALLLDTGLAGTDLVESGELGRLAGAAVREVVRLEAIAEEVVAEGTSAEGFADAFSTRLGARIGAGAVGLKSIVAYRHGLDFEAGGPSAAEVRGAAGRWLAGGGGRLVDPVILRHLIWEGVATGLPLQLHTGFGDPDEDLRRCDPALLTGFLRATIDAGAPILLLHAYPYHRQAAYLASAFPHVHLDVGLAIPHVGLRAPAVLAEALELAPFGKLLFSSDAYGAAELYLAAAAAFRDALDEVLPALGVPGAERERLGAMICSQNARRVYGLGASA